MSQRTSRSSLKHPELSGPHPWRDHQGQGQIGSCSLVLSRTFQVRSLSPSRHRERGGCYEYRQWVLGLVDIENLKEHTCELPRIQLLLSTVPRTWASRARSLRVSVLCLLQLRYSPEERSERRAISCWDPYVWNTTGLYAIQGRTVLVVTANDGAASEGTNRRIQSVGLSI